MAGGGETGRLDLPAVGAGWLLGMGVLLAAGAALAVVAWQVPAGPELLAWGALGARGAAGFLGGLRAGGRAAGGGLLHGLLTGLAVTLALALADAVRAGVPAPADLLRAGGLLLGTGALGGVLGANLAR